MEWSKLQAFAHCHSDQMVKWLNALIRFMYIVHILCVHCTNSYLFALKCSCSLCFYGPVLFTFYLILLTCNYKLNVTSHCSSSLLWQNSAWLAIHPAVIQSLICSFDRALNLISSFVTCRSYMKTPNGQADNDNDAWIYLSKKRNPQKIQVSLVIICHIWCHHPKIV